MRPRRTPAPPAVNAVDVRLLPVDLLGERDGHEVDEADAGDVARRDRGEPEQHDHRHTRRVEVGEAGDPEPPGDVGVERRARDVLAALLDHQHVDLGERQGGDERPRLLGERQLGRRRRPRRPSAPDRHHVAGRRLDRGHATEQPPVAAQRVDALQQLVAHHDRRRSSGTGPRPAACRSRRRASSCSRSRSGRGTAVCGLIRLTGMMRSAPAAWTSRCSGRPRRSWATTTVSIVERISQSRASSRHAELGQHRQLALGRGAAVAAHRRDDERRRAEVAQPGDGARAAARRAPVRPRLPAPTATVIPCSTRRRGARTTSSRAAPSTSATAGGSGTGSSTAGQPRHVIDGSIGSTTPAWSWSHPTTPTVRGSLAVDAGTIRRRDRAVPGFGSAPFRGDQIVA